MLQIKLTGRFVLRDLLVCSLVVSSSQTIIQTFWRQLLKFSHAKKVWCSPNVNFCALVVYSRHKLLDIQTSDIHTSCVFQIKTNLIKIFEGIIFTVRAKSVKTAKILLLKNLLLYGSG